MPSQELCVHTKGHQGVTEQHPNGGISGPTEMASITHNEIFLTKQQAVTHQLDFYIYTGMEL